jgi:hypothetical protein
MTVEDSEEYCKSLCFHNVHLNLKAKCLTQSMWQIWDDCPWCLQNVPSLGDLRIPLSLFYSKCGTHDRWQDQEKKSYVFVFIRSPGCPCMGLTLMSLPIGFWKSWNSSLWESRGCGCRRQGLPWGWGQMWRNGAFVLIKEAVMLPYSQGKWGGQGWLCKLADTNKGRMRTALRVTMACPWPVPACQGPIDTNL